MGCFADVSFNPEMLKTFQTQAGSMKLIFTDAAEREISVPFSLRGLSQALDALSNETLKH